MLYTYTCMLYYIKRAGGEVRTHVSLPLLLTRSNGRYFSPFFQVISHRRHVTAFFAVCVPTPARLIYNIMCILIYIQIYNIYIYRYSIVVHHCICCLHTYIEVREINGHSIYANFIVIIIISRIS